MKKLVLSNPGMKAAAFVLVLIVWLYFFSVREGVSFSVGRTKTLSASVEVMEPPASMFEVVVSPLSVILEVSGARADINRLGDDDMRVFVEVRGLRKGTYTLPVRVYTNSPVKVISREPEAVRVTIIETEEFVTPP